MMFIHTYMAAPFDGSCFGIRAILTRTFIDFNQLPKSIQRGAILIHMNPSWKQHQQQAPKKIQNPYADQSLPATFQ